LVQIIASGVIMVRRITSLASLAWTLAAGAEPRCAVLGKAFDDPNVTYPTLVLADAVACQASCAADPLCEVFTFYSNQGSCWHQTDKAKLITDLNSTLAQVSVIGPKSCNQTNTKAGGGIFVIDDASSGKIFAAASGASETGGGSNVVGWILGAAAVAIVAGGTGLYFVNSQSEPAKKSKAKTRAASVEETPPLPQMAPVATISQPMTQVQYVVAPQSYVAAPQIAPQGYEHEMPASPKGYLQPGVQYLTIPQAPVQALGYEQA